MLQHEPDQVEQIALIGRSFPNLLADDPARRFFESAKASFAESDVEAALRNAREALRLQPNYLPSHVYEELAMNVAHGRNLAACALKCRETIDLAERMLAGAIEQPPTDRHVEPEHILEQLDVVRYNYSDRLMRLGDYVAALEQVRRSDTTPKATEPMMKRRIKEASLLFRLRDREGCKMKLREARDMDRELFLLLRERMAFDGHAGVDQPI